MRLLIAPQEFKGTLTAVEAVDAMARAVRDAFPAYELDRLPMADGGPGTMEALLEANGGEKRSLTVQDPLSRPIEAHWALLEGNRAVVECAAASGLLRLNQEELDPRRATSFGTGQLIAAALDAGCDEVIIGLGGSATNDAGAGMAQALGYHLLNAEGLPLPPGGAALADLAHISALGEHPRIGNARFIAATDVTNPLCGPNGASAVYGPQKGADAAAIAELDRALGHFAEVVRSDLGVAIRDVPGAGAAGGLGAGVIAFLGGDLRSGARVVGEAAGIEARIAEADIVITGEGRLDGQTAFGKTPQYVAGLARAAGKRVICIAGSLGPGHEKIVEAFDAVETLSGEAVPLPSPEQAAAQLGGAVRRALLRLAER